MYQLGYAFEWTLRWLKFLFGYMASPCRTFENEISVRADAEQTSIESIDHRSE